MTAWLQSLEEDVGIREIPRKIFGLYKSSQERHVGLMWVGGVEEEEISAYVVL